MCTHFAASRILHQEASTRAECLVADAAIAAIVAACCSLSTKLSLVGAVSKVSSNER